MEDIIEYRIKEIILKNVQEKVDNEINKEVEKFRKKLEDRKDNFISEVIKGIRIYHEQEMNGMGINYKIVFENIYRIEKD